MNRPAQAGHSYPGEGFTFSPVGPEVVRAAQLTVAELAPREWVAELLQVLGIHYRESAPTEGT